MTDDQLRDLAKTGAEVTLTRLRARIPRSSGPSRSWRLPRRQHAVRRRRQGQKRHLAAARMSASAAEGRVHSDEEVLRRSDGGRRRSSSGQQRLAANVKRRNPVNQFVDRSREGAVQGAGRISLETVD